MLQPGCMFPELVRGGNLLKKYRFPGPLQSDLVGWRVVLRNCPFNKIAGYSGDWLCSAGAVGRFSYCGQLWESAGALTFLSGPENLHFPTNSRGHVDTAGVWRQWVEGHWVHVNRPWRWAEAV